MTFAVNTSIKFTQTIEASNSHAQVDPFLAPWAAHINDQSPTAGRMTSGGPSQLNSRKAKIATAVTVITTNSVRRLNRNQRRRGAVMGNAIENAGGRVTQSPQRSLLRIQCDPN
jgi:hypothetical protein